MKKEKAINNYLRVKGMTRAARAAMYSAGYETRIIYKKDASEYKNAEKEKAARILHYYALAAAVEIMEKIKTGDPLDLDETFYIKECFNNSISIGTGKLKGINSISTAVFLYRQCAINASIPGSICAHCYARKYAGMRPELARKLELNYVLFTTCIIPVELLPVINARYFRIESFGDVNNKIQCINYFNLCYKNPAVIFGIWTKNPHLYRGAIAAGYKKPENSVFQLSGLFENMTDADVKKIYGHNKDIADRVFIVYSLEYIKENNININCGGKCCLGCLNCYGCNDIKVIREKRK